MLSQTHTSHKFGSFTILIQRFWTMVSEAWNPEGEEEKGSGTGGGGHRGEKNAQSRANGK